MLILTRRPSEIILIGDEIEVHIVEVHGQQVRVGIKAPKGVQVDRWEIAFRRLLHPRAPA